MTITLLNGALLLKGEVPDLLLQPGDRLVVRARRDLREDYRVFVSGEVNYPGTYPITKHGTTLSQILARAGGFTEFAAIKSAAVNRSSVSSAEVETERLLSLRAGVSHEDSAYYFAETELRLRKEIVNVDFWRLFVQKDSSQDVVLQTDDHIHIPSLRRTVYVFGQVVSPGHIPFVSGESVDYYVGKAGGETERARRGDIKIVKARTKQWLSPGETGIEEGDYVWVPKDPERPFSYYMNIIGQTAAVVSVAVSIVLLVIQTNK
jgi:protein involved in polysaccharide export with SLBB domain